MAKSSHQFEIVYKDLANQLNRFVIKRVRGDPKAVEEVLASTMIAAWKGWNTFKHKSSYFTWLCRIALNKIADYYRDQVNQKSRFITPSLKALANIEDKSLSASEKMALEELRKKVNECLNLLPPEKRKLLQFRYWHDLTYKEISKLTGTSDRAVEGQIYRAKHQFAKVWEGKNDNRQISA